MRPFLIAKKDEGPSGLVKGYAQNSRFVMKDSAVPSLTDSEIVLACSPATA